MPNITIFYTDDDEDDLVFFREAVHSISPNIKLYTYQNGYDLLHALENPPPVPKVIFLDINMPTKSGYDVLCEIKNSDLLRDIPVIMYSTTCTVENVSRCKSMGANYFITKATDVNGMIESINHAIKIDWDSFKPGTANFVYKA
jgi:DNA-binding NtrC family response regulator